MAVEKVDVEARIGRLVCADTKANVIVLAVRFGGRERARQRVGGVDAERRSLGVDR